MNSSVVDNDVLIKLACYRLLESGLREVSLDGPAGVLGAARYVVPDAIGRNPRIADREGALEAWRAAEELVAAVEPTDDEIELAAEVEEVAARRGLQLDAGESQLFAVVAHRSLDFVVTGDKRAIAALEQVALAIAKMTALYGKVVCLEQLVARLVVSVGAVAVRDLICSEPRVDRALAACMSCASAHEGSAFSTDGLASYVAHLREAAPLVSASDDTF